MAKNKVAEHTQYSIIILNVCNTDPSSVHPVWLETTRNQKSSACGLLFSWLSLKRFLIYESTANSVQGW